MAAVDVKNIRPSFFTGFANHQYESKHPEYWQGLLGMWAPCLGVTGSKLYDFSGRNWHATINNYPTNQSWGLGKYGQCINTDGTSTNEWALASPHNIGTVHSFTAWIYTSFTNEEFILFGGQAWNDGGYLWWADYAGSANLYDVYYSGDGTTVGLEMTITNNTWHQIGISRNGTIIRWYLDGKYMGTDTLAADKAVDTFQYVHSLAADSTAYSFNGKISHAMLWNRTLRDSDFLFLQQHPLAPLELADVPMMDSGAAPPVGNAAIMTPNTGFWGPTF